MANSKLSPNALASIVMRAMLGMSPAAEWPHRDTAKRALHATSDGSKSTSNEVSFHQSRNHTAVMNHRDATLEYAYEIAGDPECRATVTEVYS